ncbi:MAG TPA: bacteriocin [Xanthobacteraceae bacterium]|nr:bacteriocin [Xanthobacteraceae bacterium]
MRKILLVVAAASALAGCQTAREDNALAGAALGGATGAVVGGLAGGTAGSAVAGGVVGAAAGGILGAATTPPEPCYVRTRSGRLREVPCY